MSAPTPFHNLVGTPRNELEHAIFEGIIDQSTVCAKCKAEIIDLLNEVFQVNKPIISTADPGPLEIFSYDTKEKAIRRIQLADRQPADTDQFVRPTVTRMSVEKALYSDIEASIPAAPGPRGFPTWHSTVLARWVENMTTLSLKDAELYTHRFVFAVHLFEYRKFLRVGDAKDLFVSQFVARPQGGDAHAAASGDTRRRSPRSKPARKNQGIYDRVYVADSRDLDDEFDPDSGSDDDSADLDFKAPRRNKRGNKPFENPVTDPRPPQSLTSCLNEASCQLLAAAYWSRVQTFHLGDDHQGIRDCQCTDFQAFQCPLETPTGSPYWAFERRYRAFLLRFLGAAPAMVQTGLDFTGFRLGNPKHRTLQRVVECLMDDLAYAITEGSDESWFRMFSALCVKGREVDRARFADEVLPRTGNPRWALDADGKLVRLT